MTKPIAALDKNAVHGRNFETLINRLTQNERELEIKLKKAKSAVDRNRYRLEACHNAVIEIQIFIEKTSPFTLGNGVTTSLYQLSLAIRDTLLGSKPDLLFNCCSLGGKPSDLSARTIIRAFGVACLKILKDAKVRSPAKVVADCFKGANIRMPKSDGTNETITIKQIGRWPETTKKSKQKTTLLIVQQVRMDWKDRRQNNMEADPEAFVAEAIKLDLNKLLPQ